MNRAQRRARKRAIGGALLTGAAVVGPAAAAKAEPAFTYDPPSGALTATNDGEFLGLYCNPLSSPDGVVTYFAEGQQPVPGNIRCGDVRTIQLNGTPGTVDDNFSLVTLTAGAFPALEAVTINAGAGNDSVVSGSDKGASIVTNGGDGNDTLRGSDAGDIIDPGPGVDEVDGDAGTDTLRATGLVAPATLTNIALTGGGGDTLIEVEQAQLQLGSPGTLDTTTFSGPVTLTGSSGPDTISSGADADVVTGGGGGDVISTGAGADRVEAFDLATDTVDCGADADTAVADKADSLIACESQTFPTPPVTPKPPVTPPTVDATGPRVAAPKPKFTRKRKVQLTVRCPAGEAVCKGRISAKATYRVNSKVRTIKLGSRAFTVTGGQRKKVTLRTPRRSRNALLLLGPRRLKVAVTLKARDAAGNLTVKRKSFRAKLPALPKR